MTEPIAVEGTTAQPDQTPDRFPVRTHMETGLDVPMHRAYLMYLSLRDQQHQIDARLKELKGQLAEYARQHGTRDSQSGHYQVRLESPVQLDGVTYQGWQHQARKSLSLDTDAAYRILGKKGLLPLCAREVTEFDQDAIYEHFAAGEISQDEIDEMFSEKLSWSLVALTG